MTGMINPAPRDLSQYGQVMPLMEQARPEMAPEQPGAFGMAVGGALDQARAMQEARMRRDYGPQGNSAAYQQLAQGIQQAQQGQIAMGAGVRGVAPGIAQALAARNAANVQSQGDQQLAMLQAQERAAAAQQQAQMGLFDQQMALQQNLMQSEEERRRVAAEMAQQGSWITGGLGLIGTGIGALYGGPAGAAFGGAAGGYLGNALTG